MKKLRQIDRLVEEVLDNKGYAMSVGRLKEKQLLMNLAKKCAEIEPYDFNAIGNRTDKYNFLLREGQVKLEPKHEEKPALQPLPEEMPEWFNTFCGANQKYKELRQHFGTHPREWWMDLKKGDKFLHDDGIEGEIRTYDGHYVCIDGFFFIYSTEEGEGVRFSVGNCTPYTPPSPLYQLLSTFTPEQKALWDAIKEGKDE